MNTKILEKTSSIINTHCGEDTYCTLGLIDIDGGPSVSTITAAKADGINWITFCTGQLSPKVSRIKKCNKASVCFNSPEYNITLNGTIEIITDPQIKKEMWYNGLANNFRGYDDPAYCVLKFTTEKYNLLVDWQEVHGTL